MTFQITNQKNNLYLPSSAEMAGYDKSTISKGISGSVLMERAGVKMFELIKTRYLSSNKAEHLKILCLCGPGNNGGDGFVVARLLKQAKFDVSVIRVRSDKYTRDNAEQSEKFIKCGGTLIYSDNPGCRDLISDSDLLIDAILGIGQESALRGSVLVLVNALNKYRKDQAGVISLDVPTGVNATSGEVYDPAISAGNTITVEFIKRGMLQYPAAAGCGIIDTIEIGIEADKSSEFRILAGGNIPAIRKRQADSHKGDFGHVLIIGGSKNYPGAPVLAATAAIKTGAGLVTYAGLSSCLKSALPPELMLRNLKDNSGNYNASHFSQLKKELGDFSSVVIGPGLGQSGQAGEFCGKLIRFVSENKIPAVLDADGLNFLSDLIKSKKKNAKPDLKSCVLTPHPGEMARLLDCKTEAIQKDRYSAVRKLSEMFNTTVVLKGVFSLIYSGRTGFVNITGNPYMATGGSGDVLSGIIAGFMAQGYDNLQAAALAVRVHGYAGDLACKNENTPIIAGDIIDQIPYSISKHQ